MNINYIVAFYLDVDRWCLDGDIYYHLKKHLSALENLNIPHISVASFIVNESPQLNKEEFERVVDGYNITVPIEIKYRGNRGLSYGAWEYHIRSVLGKFDYYVLMEDDYYPICDLFYMPFIDKIKDNVAYVCMSYKDNHPEHSIGVISDKSCRKVFDINNEIFFGYNKLELGICNYSNMCTCNGAGPGIGAWQACFHRDFLKIGELVDDIREYPTYFKHRNGSFQDLHGNHTMGGNKSLIIPTQFV